MVLSGSVVMGGGGGEGEVVVRDVEGEEHVL